MTQYDNAQMLYEKDAWVIVLSIDGVLEVFENNKLRSWDCLEPACLVCVKNGLSVMPEDIVRHYTFFKAMILK